MSQSPPSRRVSVDAPAKINLFLHVTGRRDDGYHLLESLVAFTDAGDRITAVPADDLSLSVEGPFAAGLADAGKDNLVLRAARALREAGEIRSGARIVLEKNLPVSSGIGGGSTDAAAALRALGVLWKVDLADRQLADIGIVLGADVPVCLNARTAMMSGVGERIDNVESLPPCAVVLVNALEAVSTPAVFGARNAKFTQPAGWESPAGFDAMISALSDRRNDLLAPARIVSPVIGEVLAALEGDAGCAMARLSGSGGTGFGLFADVPRAESAARRIKAEHPDWWCVAATFRESAPAIRTDP